VPSASGGLARAARDQARAILSKPPFSTSSHPSALQRFFHDLGQWLYEAFGRFALHRILDPLRDGLHAAFGSWWPLALGLIVAALAVVVGVGLGRRRARVGVARAERLLGGRDEDPDELDTAAERAERAGDYDLAVRLRFRAGLARLERRGLIRDRRTHTTAQLGEVLRSPTFDGLAARVDSVVYGGVAATAADVAAARAGWPQVPGEAHRDGRDRPAPALVAAGSTGAGGPEADGP